MALYDFEIGSTYVGMVNVEELPVPLPPPASTYRRYALQIDLGDDMARGFGLPAASWRWQVLTLAQRDQLKTFCSSASAQVFIQTKKRDSTEVYDEFTAVMIWPEEEEAQAGRVLDFVIEFRSLVEYVP